MTTEQSARSVVMSTTIDEIILEKIVTKTMQAGEVLSFDFLADRMQWAKSHIKFLKNFQNELFSINTKGVKATDDVQLLTEKSKVYIRNAVKRLVYASLYRHDSVEQNVWKFFADKYYTQQEVDFVDQMCNEFFEICAVELDDSQDCTDKYLLNFNSVNYSGFNYVARDVYNGIISKTLYAGDDITNFAKEFCDRQEFSARAKLSLVYDYFFEMAEGKIILRCDLVTNKKILIMNFLNTAIYRLWDDASKIKLLKQLHTKNGLSNSQSS